MTTLEKLKEKLKRFLTQRRFYLKSYGVQFFFLFTLPWIDTGFQQQWVSPALDYSFAVLFYFLTGYTVLTIFHIKSDKNVKYKRALPNIILQTDLFWFNYHCFLSKYADYTNGMIFMGIGIFHTVIPIFPLLVVMTFFLGLVIDRNKAPQKQEGKNSFDPKKDGKS